MQKDCFRVLRFFVWTSVVCEIESKDLQRQILATAPQPKAHVQFFTHMDFGDVLGCRLQTTVALHDTSPRATLMVLISLQLLPRCYVCSTTMERRNMRLQGTANHSLSRYVSPDTIRTDDFLVLTTIWLWEWRDGNCCGECWVSGFPGGRIVRARVGRDSRRVWCSENACWAGYLPVWKGLPGWTEQQM